MSRQRQKGFTLIEVLVAFAILSLSLAALFQIYTTAFGNTHAARKYSLATSFAESKITEIASSPSLTSGQLEGHLPRDFRWKATVTEQDAFSQSALLKTYVIAVTVAWGAPRDERVVNLVTYRAVSRE